jgi:REP element-mobilizing transposase RayT
LAVIVRGEGVLGEIVAGVVMDDHVHVLIALHPEVTAQRTAQTWKSVSSHGLTREFGRTSPVWQRQYLDRWFRDRPGIEACGAYVLENPFRRRPSIEVYPWIVRSGLSPTT